MSYQGNYPPSTPLTSSQIAAGAVQPTNLSTQGPYWDGSGNLGVGTTSPGAKLQVTGTGTSTSFRGNVNAIFASNGSGYDSTIRLSDTVANSADLSMKGGVLATSVNGVFATYINSSGNVGIGSSSPDYLLTLQTSDAAISFKDSGGTTRAYMGVAGITGSAPTGALRLRSDEGGIVFVQTGSETARIDTSGNLLVGTTTSTGYRLSLESADNQYSMRNSSAAAGKRWRFSCDTNNTVYIINQNTNGVYMGDGSTSWSGLSDERSKDIIEPIEDAVRKVSSLRAVIGKYKNDKNGTRRSFLIAQDVQSVLPEAVNIANQENGHLGLSYTDVIPLLVAAIQELSAKNDALEARLAALEAK